MHMADALVSPAVAGSMYLCSGAAAVYAARKVKHAVRPVQIPVMGVMGAFVFAAQMINFTIPGTGSSGHITGGMLLSAMLGPEAGFLTMISVLVIQALVFADGGILALGANVWNMAFYGCFVGGLLIWRLAMRGGISRRRIAAASVIGCVVSAQLGAFSVVLETGISGITELPFPVFVGLMQPIHLVIGAVEGIITAAVLSFVFDTEPSLLEAALPAAVHLPETEADAIVAHRRADSKAEAAVQQPEERALPGGSSRRTGRGELLLIFGLTAIVLAALVSRYASTHPDGLEWAIGRTAGTEELTSSGALAGFAEQVQEQTAAFPDYDVAGRFAAAHSLYDTVIGACIVTAVFVLGCLMVRRILKRESIRRIERKGTAHGADQQSDSCSS